MVQKGSGKPSQEGWLWEVVFRAGILGRDQVLEKGKDFLRPDLFIGDAEWKPVVESGSCSY